MYPGWQVWGGGYYPVRAGEDLTAAVEFAQLSPLLAAAPGAEPRLEALSGNRYRATARVLDTDGAVVLDLGALRALRVVWAGRSAGDFVTGATVCLELSLSLDAWDHSPESRRAAELYGTAHRWHVRRIRLRTVGQDDETEIAEAAIETVEGDASHYCLLECVRLG